MSGPAGTPVPAVSPAPGGSAAFDSRVDGRSCAKRVDNAVISYHSTPGGMLEIVIDVDHDVLAPHVESMRFTVERGDPAVEWRELDHAGAQVFALVEDALQEAEEIGGPEGDAYIDLMRAVIHECRKRIDTYTETRR